MSGRRHEGRGAGGAHAPEAQLPAHDPTQAALARRLHERQRWEPMRAELREHASQAVQAVLTGANLFQMAVRGLGEAALRKQLEPDVAGKVAHKAVDHLLGKLKSGLVAATDIGTHLVSHASTVFGTIKGTVDARVKTERALNLLEVADHVTAAVQDQAIVLERALRGAVDALSPDQLAAIAGLMNAAELSAPLDPDDSEERGDLRQGLRTHALTERVGMPAGDKVAAEEIATDAFAAFQVEVAASGTAAEHTDAIKHRLAHPDEDRQRVRAAEERMGPEYQHELARDRTLRGRVKAVLP